MIYQGHFITDKFEVIAPHTLNSHFYLGKFKDEAQAKKAIDERTYALSEIGGLYEEVCLELTKEPVYIPNFQPATSPFNINDLKNIELRERESLRTGKPLKSPTRIEQEERKYQAVMNRYIRKKRELARRLKSKRDSKPLGEGMVSKKMHKEKMREYERYQKQQSL